MYVLLDIRNIVICVTPDLIEEEDAYISPSRGCGYAKCLISKVYSGVEDIPEDYGDGLFTFDGEEFIPMNIEVTNE